MAEKKEPERELTPRERIARAEKSLNTNVFGEPIKQPILGSKKKGGPIKKTGIYKLHKGERVVPAKAQSARDIAMLKRAKYR